MSPGLSPEREPCDYRGGDLVQRGLKHREEGTAFQMEMEWTKVQRQEAWARIRRWERGHYASQ